VLKYWLIDKAVVGSKEENYLINSIVDSSRIYYLA
jgi:hypothetical protein